ncbi:hypothetical protein TNCV_475751 [Trichonephila clavipes]|nr:hypothetical protein TNCV_475751 [Trichonephila clavipes]
MMNQHRTQCRKPHLVGENRDSSRQENDEPNEGLGQTNVGIDSAVVGLKKPARVHLLQDVLATVYNNVGLFPDGASP